MVRGKVWEEGTIVKMEELNINHRSPDSTGQFSPLSNVSSIEDYEDDDYVEVFGSTLVKPGSLTPYTDATQSKKKTAHVKRPMNAFMVWAQMERRKIVRRQPNLHNADISKYLGKRWKNMSAAERAPYEEEAAKLAEFHRQQWPEYKYKPRKKGKGAAVVSKTVKKTSGATKRSKSKRQLGHSSDDDVDDDAADAALHRLNPHSRTNMKVTQGNNSVNLSHLSLSLTINEQFLDKQRQQQRAGAARDTFAAQARVSLYILFVSYCEQTTIIY